MKRILVPLGTLFLCGSLFAWIDYDDKVENKQAKFGKDFEGCALQLYTDKVEFEQEMPEKVTVVLRSRNDRATLLPAPRATKTRRYALYIVVADKNGTSLFSRNLLEGKSANPVLAGTLKPRASQVVISVPFDQLEVAGVDEYLDGMPFFDEKTRMRNAGKLVPHLYTLKAVLLSGEPEKRPDFAVASDLWQVILRPKSPARMTEAERQVKLKAWLATMSQGAVAGGRVSSQLASLGDTAVPALIKLSEKRAEAGMKPDVAQAVADSRIWAIVTLCNTRSRAAEDYIMKRLKDPLAFRELSFIVWHSQGFHSKRVTETLRAFAEDASNGRPMPWEKKHGRKSRGYGRGACEYVFKHFSSRGASVTDQTIVGCIARGDPKLTAFALAAWKPSSGEAALKVLKPLWTKADLHPNVRRASAHALARAMGGDGFPKYNSQADPDIQWIADTVWLYREKHLSPQETLDGLRNTVFQVRKENDKPKVLLMKILGKLARKSGYPVTGSTFDMPADWDRTWVWALRTSTIDKTAATQFLCRQMRTREALPAVTKRALLVELKRVIGDKFPLASTAAARKPEAWNICGQWLVDNGYFGADKKKKPKAMSGKASKLGDSQPDRDLLPENQGPKKPGAKK
ncbi:MAG: hypothetical protein KAI66_24240 [Lentisphaeria bacterium]|nr:hypothetical protein [Lentisphaeria bacterium]